jgi:uncharacterized protein (TIGR02058 family)
MSLKKFIVEIGQGIDQHGQDPTKAARKAVADAISRSCLCGLVEIIGLKDLNQIEVEVLIACPYPEKVRTEEVLEVIPFGRKRLEVIEGGMIARGIYQPELGDKSDEILVANAAVTVWVSMEKEG